MVSSSCRFNSMKQMVEMEPDSIEYLCLDFTATIQVFDQMETVDLKPGGANIDLTKDNLSEYVELQMKRLLFDQQRDQLNAMLLGLYEVIPQHLIQIFDYQGEIPPPQHLCCCSYYCSYYCSTKN